MKPADIQSVKDIGTTATQLELLTQIRDLLEVISKK